MPRLERAVFAVCWMIALVLIIRWTNSGGGNEAAVALLAHGGLGLTAVASRARQRTITRQRTQLAGRITFTFSGSNGRYSIGAGDGRFDTAWSRSDSESVNLYNDPSSLDGITVAEGVRSFSQLGDARRYEMTGLVRTACENEIIVLKNRAGCYAAIKIIRVADSPTRGGADELTFDYVILPRGVTDFAGSR